jgi:hypothetical protein
MSNLIEGISTDGPPSQEHHLCRMRAAVLGPLEFGVILVIFLGLFWTAFDWNFTTETASSYATGSRRGGAILFLLLLAILPVWVRVPLLLGAFGCLMRYRFRRLRYAFDDVPDLVIGPEGVSGLDELGYCSIAWSDVSSVDARPLGIRIYGPERKAHWLIRLITGERIMFYYSQFIFKAPYSEIMSAIRHYRPDLCVGAPQT